MESSTACSFCDASEGERQTLIAGPSAIICDQCADLCNEALEGQEDEEDDEDDLAGDEQPRCSFCGMSKADAGPLVTRDETSTAPAVSICRECVDTAREIAEERAGAPPPAEPQPRCSFCGLTKGEAGPLAAGEEASICASCVDLCREALRADAGAPPEPAGDVSERAGATAPGSAPAPAPQRVTRTITFPHAHWNAGMALVLGLTRIVHDRAPRLDVTTVLRARGLTVELSVEAEDVEAMEAALDDYGRVVEGVSTPEECVRDPRAAAELRRHLDLVRTVLRGIDGGDAPDEERARRLYLALGWILRGDVEDIEELFA